MVVKRAYRYRVYPTPEQAQNLACTFGCVRFVYNWALHKRKRAYFDQGIKLYTKDLSAAIPALKKAEGTAWLKEVSSVPLQQALRHLDAAYTNFFEGRADSPTFKKKHHEQAATYTDNAFTFKDGKLTLAKHQEPLHIIWSRPLPDGCKPSSVTVSKDKSGRYFVSILVQEDIEPLAPSTQEVGVDVGLKSFVVLSTRLIRENQTVCVESLNVKGMLQNRCLAKAIADVGWGEFTRQLDYKARWYGRTFVKIDRFSPSSKTCSACGHILETLTLDVREWACPVCGVVHDRDTNAALNILAEGLSVMACGGAVRRDEVRASHAGTVETGKPHREVRNPLPF